MALIKCPECGQEVSDQAPACIHCGYPLNAQQQEPPQPETVSPTDQLVCPKCGSTDVTTSLRGWSVMTGFMRSGQTVNRCGACGHTWKPRK